jgi:uncharacterized membrane protein
MIEERAAAAEAIPVFRGPSPLVRRAGLDQPWVWIGRGWNDLMAAPSVGFGYGGAFVVAGFAIALALYAGGSLYLLIPLAAGFMLLAPLFAVGLYETSRRLAAGEPADLKAAMLAFRTNPEHIAYMGLVLMLLNLFWTRMATLIFAIFFGVPRANLQDLVDLTLFSPQALPFLIVGTLVGFVLAAATFAISAVSIPMLLDRPQTPVWIAIATSFVVVRENLKPMALWAVLICGFSVLGMVPFFLGLALTMPLVGYASWHCYKDMVVYPDA